VDESLKALNVDYFDLLMIHWPNPEIPVSEAVKGLARAKRKGVARHIGVANFNIALIDEARNACPEPIAALQAEYHPYLDQTKLLAACRRHGIAPTAYSPIARGKVKDDQVLAKIGQAHKKTPAQICLRYLVQQGIVVIPRTSKVERLTGGTDHPSAVTELSGDDFEVLAEGLCQLPMDAMFQRCP